MKEMSMKRYPNLYYGVYGVLSATVIMLICNNLLPHFYEMMPTRLRTLNWVLLDTSDYGIAELLIHLIDHNSPYYFYLGFLARFLDIHDAAVLFDLVQKIGMFAVLAVYPLMFWQIFKSRLAALASSWLLVIFGWWFFIRWVNADYWGGSWCVLFCVPLLICMYRSSKMSQVFCFFILTILLAAVGNVIRAHIGLACVLAGLAILGIKACRILQNHSVKAGVILLGMLLTYMTYGLFTQTIPNIFLQTVTPGASRAPLLGPWHSAYIGVGWDSPESMKYKLFVSDNPFGIFFKDECAMEVVKQKLGHPFVDYKDYIEEYGERQARMMVSSIYAPPYGDVIEAEYIGLWQEEPLYMIKSYAKKSIYIFLYTVIKVLPVYLLGYLIYQGLRRRYYIRPSVRNVLCPLTVCVFVAIIDCAFAFLATPSNVYLQGTYAALYLIIMFVLGNELKAMEKKAR